MPTLYTMPGTCSLSPNIAVAWLHAPVEIHNIPYGDQKKEYYLNPRGQVPCVDFYRGNRARCPCRIAWNDVGLDLCQQLSVGPAMELPLSGTDVPAFTG